MKCNNFIIAILAILVIIFVARDYYKRSKKIDIIMPITVISPVKPKPGNYAECNGKKYAIYIPSDIADSEVIEYKEAYCDSLDEQYLPPTP